MKYNNYGLLSLAKNLDTTILRLPLLKTSKSFYKSVKDNIVSPKCAKNKNICILFQVSKDLFLLFQLSSFIIHEISQNLPKVV